MQTWEPPHPCQKSITNASVMFLQDCHLVLLNMNEIHVIYSTILCMFTRKEVSLSSMEHISRCVRLQSK